MRNIAENPATEEVLFPCGRVNREERNGSIVETFCYQLPVGIEPAFQRPSLIVVRSPNGVGVDVTRTFFDANGCVVSSTQYLEPYPDQA